MMLADEFFLGTKLYHKKLVELCKPIAKYLGVTHSFYYSTDKNGRVFCISTDHRWVGRFLEEQYYKVASLMVHPDNMHTGFSFDSSCNHQEFQDTLLYDAVINYGWYHSFAYVEKTNDGGYFGFDFGTSKDNYQVITRLMNEAHIIRNFIRDLNQKLNLLINKDLLENSMDFIALKGNAFYSQTGLVYNAPQDKQQKIKLLQEVGVLSVSDKQQFLTNDTLSPQEKAEILESLQIKF